AGSTQKAAAKVPRGSEVVFIMRVDNEGNVADSIGIRGRGDRGRLGVRYLAGYTGMQGITRAVESGTYHTATFAPGSARVIRLVVRVGRGARVGASASWILTAASRSSSAARDAVKAVVTVVR